MNGKLSERFRSVTQNENNVLVLTAVLVGILGGLGAISLEFLLRYFSHVFFGSDGIQTGDIIRVAIAPVIGGAIAGPLVARGAPEAKGHGVPEVIQAVALKGGRIRGRVAVVKTIASAITIGSGGSAGREGPIVQVGSTMGSKVGQILKMSEQRVRLLVGCGAAAGISAAFNAPLAGVFFALEIVLQRFTARGFATVVLSAVTSSVIWRAAFGNNPVLAVPRFGLVNPIEVVFYIVLGLLAALVALTFVKVLYWLEDRFESIPLPDDVKPAIGGAVLGGIGVAMIILVKQPLVYGTGLIGINLALSGSLVWWALLALLAGKVLATTFTLGSGASGGDFAPSLFMGAMLGALFGQAVHALLPTATAPAGAYAMVGMAAVFAAAAQAPITAILVLFEMTNDYLIMVPLMVACMIATVAYGMMHKHSIYTEKLARRGVELTGGRERHLLERTPVRRAILTDVPVLALPANVGDARAALSGSSYNHVLIVDAEQRFVGVVTRERLAEAEAADEDQLDAHIVVDVPTITRYQSLDAAFQQLAPRGLRMLPVVDTPNSGIVVGMVTRDSLMAAYWTALNEDRSESDARS